MSDKFLALILYPALSDGLTQDERDALKRIIEDLEGTGPGHDAAIYLIDFNGHAALVDA